MRDTMIAKSQPTQSSVHVDRPLTNMSELILQDPAGFVADTVFPIIPVARQSDKYRTYPRGFFSRDEMAKRAAGAQTKGIGYETSTVPYFCDVWGLHHDIDEQTEENADEEVNLDFEAMTLLSEAAKINRELQWRDNFFVTGKWTAETTPGTLWSAASSTPLEDIEVVRLAFQGRTGRKPNVAIMGPQVWSILKNHADLVDRLNRGQTSGAATALLSNLAELIEVPRVLVADSIVNSAVEGATDSFGFGFGKHMLLLHVANAPGRYTASAGYTFAWTGLSGSNVAGTRIKRFEMLPESSRRVEIESSYQQKQIADDLGSMILGAVA